MAVIAFAITPLKQFGDRAHVIFWEAMDTNDTGQILEMPGSADRSVQVLGDFGTNGSLSMEGSNDGGTIWFQLTDPQGADVIFTAAGGLAISELTRHVRPNLTLGTNPDIDVHLLVKRT